MDSLWESTWGSRLEVLLAIDAKVLNQGEIPIEW